MNPTSSNSPAMVHVPEAELSKLVHRALARLGLSDAHVQAIAKVIVENHHGQIQLESTVNQGTTFTVTLPSSRPESRISIA